jgi:hypothetical protein
MWGVASAVFTASGVATLVGTEILRSLVHRHRERRDGLGGTQDIALVGQLVAGVCVLGASICGVVWLSQR